MSSLQRFRIPFVAFFFPDLASHLRIIPLLFSIPSMLPRRRICCPAFKSHPPVGLLIGECAEWALEHLELPLVEWFPFFFPGNRASMGGHTRRSVNWTLTQTHFDPKSSTCNKRSPQRGAEQLKWMCLYACKKERCTRLEWSEGKLCCNFIRWIFLLFKTKKRNKYRHTAFYPNVKSCTRWMKKYGRKMNITCNKVLRYDLRQIICLLTVVLPVTGRKIEFSSIQRETIGSD